MHCDDLLTCDYNQISLETCYLAIMFCVAFCDYLFCQGSLTLFSCISICRLTNNILSTAQQVWLQKLGGAKNPLNQFGNNTIKLDAMQNQKSESEFMENSATTQLSSTKKVAEKENLTVEGPRPGERLQFLVSVRLTAC